MKLKTSRFGEIDIEEDNVVTFPRGLPGFEEINRYVFLHPDAESPFSFMQALDDKNLAFVVTDPFLFFPDYEFELSEEIKKELEIGGQTPLMIRCIVTIREKVEEATMNLLAPVIVNVEKKLGRQIVLHDSPYQLKHRLFPGRQAGRQGKGE